MKYEITNTTTALPTEALDLEEQLNRLVRATFVAEAKPGRTLFRGRDVYILQPWNPGRPFATSFSEDVEAAFHWRLLSLMIVSESEEGKGPFTFTGAGVAVGDGLKEMFASAGFSGALFFSAKQQMKKVGHRTYAVFDPRTAELDVTLGIKPGVEPDLLNLANDLDSFLTMASLRSTAELRASRRRRLHPRSRRNVIDIEPYTPGRLCRQYRLGASYETFAAEDANVRCRPQQRNPRMNYDTDFDDGEHAISSIANLSLDEIENMISGAYACHFLHAPEIAAGYCYVIWQETLSPWAPSETREWMEAKLDDADILFPAANKGTYVNTDGYHVEIVEWLLEGFAAIVSLVIRPDDAIVRQQYIDALHWAHPRFGNEGIDEPYDIAWNMQMSGGMETLATVGRHHGTPLDPRVAALCTTKH